MKLFDYLFVRIYNFYNKRPNEVPVVSSCIIISLLLSFTLLSMFFLLSVILKFKPTDNIKPVALLISIIISVPFWRRYINNNFGKELVSNYKDEEKGKKRLRGWLIILYLILVMLIPAVIGYMRHNLGMDI